MRDFRNLLPLLLITLTPLRGVAQLFDAYLDTTVADVYVTIDQAKLDSLWNGDPYSDYEYRCAVKMVQNGKADSVSNAGFRFRGNTSRVSKKKSFKISINTFTKGQRLLGYKDFNLNGEHNDPSLVRAKIVWEMFNKAGLPSTRARHVRLWVNNTFYGVYLSVEHVNDDFLQRRFGNQNGNLYKCLHPADLTWKGDDQSNYKFLRNNTERTYDLKTNEAADDYSDLASFITFVNRTSDIEFSNRIEERFNVDGFLRYLAVCVLSGNWDNYWYLKNNFYLYNNPASGRFEFFPYDVDNTLGVDWIGRDWAQRNMYTWGHESEPRPLASRILGITRFRDRFTHYVDVFRPQFANADTLSKIGQRAQALIRTDVSRDPYYSRDYGYGIADFDASMNSAQGGHVKYGIIPFINLRAASVSQQMMPGTVGPIVRDILKPVVFSGRPYSLSVLPAGPQTVDSTFVHISNNSGTTRIAGRFESASGYFTIDIPAQTVQHGVRIEMKDRAGRTGWWPSPSALYPHLVNVVDVGTLYPLRINEFLADNATGLRDEAGDLEDWIEIVNTGNAAVNLSGYYLTDNLARPDKWAFPSYQAEPGAFLVVFADEEASEGPLHAAFKLSRGGEEIGLFFKSGNQFILVDSVRFKAQTTDVSSGRVPDATGNWQFLNPPTPGRSNLPPVNAEREALPAALSLVNHPNPFNGQTTLTVSLPEAANTRITVSDITGRQLFTLYEGRLSAGVHFFRVNANRLATGTYLIRLEAGSSVRTRKIVLLR